MIQRLVHGFSTDLRLAVRRLAAAPLFSVFAVLSLAMGLAVTTAVYSVVHALFFEELGIGEPSTVAYIVTPYDGRLLTGSISDADFRDLRAAQTSFAHLSASTSFAAAVSSPSGTESVPVEAVDGWYFAALGVSATIGRAIQPKDDDGAASLAVLSDALWRSRFAADPSVVGQTIRIGGRSFDVIGVAPPMFGGSGSGLLRRTRLWIPLSAEGALNPVTAAAPSRDRRRLVVFGRLAPAAGVERASAELMLIAATLDRAFPPPTRGGRPGTTERRWRVKSAQAIANEDTPLRRFGLALVALVGLVLLVACTNLANLVLARATARQRDLAIRRAMGASRWRLVREQCTESALVAIGGAIAAFAVFQILRVAITTDFNISLPQPAGTWTLAIRPSLNAPVLVMSAGALFLSLIVFGLEPALQLTRSLDVHDALAAGSGVGPPRAARQQMLLRWQVAIAAGFFIVATMFVKYTIAEARHDPGVEMDRLAVAVLDVRSQHWDETRVRRAIGRVLEEGGRDGTVAAMAVSTGMPFGIPAAMRLTISSPERIDERRIAVGIGATPAIFRTLGVAILRGRGFTDRDEAGGPAVAVISELAARQIFGTIDAVGRRLTLAGRPGTPVATVVGVAGRTDVMQILFERPLVYLPLAQQYEPNLTVALRSTEDAARAVGTLREVIRRADPDLAVDIADTGRAILSGPWVILRAMGLSAIALGGLTLLLAMAGLYGIQSHVVTHRTREIGVRMSFGASAGQIRMMVLKDGYRPVFEGMAIGLFIGIAGRAIVRTYLELDVAIVDPWMLLVTPVPLVLAAFCACYLPASRAAATDPAVALRCE